MMKTRSRFRAESWLSLVVVAALVIFVDTEAALAKCGPQPAIRVVSISTIFGLNIDFDRKNTFSVIRNGEKIASGELIASGHHLGGLIDDTGAFFVLHDKYEGLTIYNRTGQVLKHFLSRQLLSFREEQTRPGKWTCHMEGSWSSGVSLGADGTVVVRTHEGRRIVIDLASTEGIEEEHDLAQLAIVVSALVLLLVGGAGILGRIWWLAK
jgi:hypothetical protein